MREQTEYNESDTVALMLEALRNVGLLPIVKDTNIIWVDYRGETFLIELQGKYSVISDMNWMTAKPDDSDLPILDEAINQTNFINGPKAMLLGSDDNLVCLHSKWSIIFDENYSLYIPDFTKVLDEFFDLKDRLRENFCIIKSIKDSLQQQ